MPAHFWFRSIRIVSEQSESLSQSRHGDEKGDEGGRCGGAQESCAQMKAKKAAAKPMKAARRK